MAKVIRFAVKSPVPPDLTIESVPATFTRRVWDVDVDTSDGAIQAGKMRYLGQPYGVIELGQIE